MSRPVSGDRPPLHERVTDGAAGRAHLRPPDGLAVGIDTMQHSRECRVGPGYHGPDPPLQGRQLVLQPTACSRADELQTVITHAIDVTYPTSATGANHEGRAV